MVPKFSGHGVVISAMDFVKGIGKMALLSPLEVEGATGDLDSDLRAKAEAAIAAIEGMSLCCFILTQPRGAGAWET